MDLIREELESMESEAISQSEKRSLLSVLRDRKLLLPLILVCALLGGQQLSGLNAIFFYSVSIFERAGLSSTDAKWANLGAGCINFLVASFTPYLMAKVNRRPLVFWSTVASGVMLVILTVVTALIVGSEYFERVKLVKLNHFQDLATWLPYACIASVFGYIIGLQLGLGPIPYFIGTGWSDLSSLQLFDKR